MLTAAQILILLGGTSSSIDPLAPHAPSLALDPASDSGSSSSDNITNNNTPNLFFVSDTLVAGDILTIRDGGVILGSPHTVSAGEAAAGTTIALGLSALSDGTHSLTATQTRSGHTSPNSTPLVLTIRTVAPTLSSPAGVQLAQTTASLSVSTTAPDGTLYWVVTASATPPTATQVKAGQNDGGTAALASANQTVSASGAQAATATGLTVGTRYAYYVHVDAAGNQSTVSASSSWSQADITSPTLSAASGVATAQTTATLSVTTNKAAGTLYAVVTTRNTAPSVAQVKAGQDDLGAAGAFSASQAVSSTGAKTFSATGLTNGLSGAVTYYTYFVHNNGGSFDSAVASATWSQPDVTAPTLSSPSASATGATTASLSVSTNENNGTLYWVLTTSATPPSVAQVKAGQNNAGGAAAASGNQVVSATGSQSANASGLTAVTTYFAYFVHADVAVNNSNVAAASSITTSAAATNWNPSDKSANLTLSNGNLTETKSAAGNAFSTVRAASSKSSGKFYFEIHVDASAGTGNNGFGLSNSTQALSAAVGFSSTNSIGYFSGFCFVNSSSAGRPGPTFAVGDTLCFAVDFTNGKMWCRNGAGNWNATGGADPATNTSGNDITALTGGPFFPACSMFAQNDAATANFGATAFSQAVPSGFTSGWS